MKVFYKRQTIFFGLVVLQVVAAVCFGAASDKVGEQPTNGPPRTYYVDSENGNYSGSGTQQRPIVVGCYGEKARPRIDGEGKVLDTMLIRNAEYWQVSGLEVTNLGPQCRPWQTGVRIEMDGYGTMHNIHLSDLYVHNVNGDLRKSHEGCGIFFEPRFVGVHQYSGAKEGETAQRIGGSSRKVNLNRNWRFYLGRCRDAMETGFDDSSWRLVHLPHDYSVERQASSEYASGTAYLPGGIGWYRKRFVVPQDVKGRKIYVMFEGVYKNSRVWCNGRLLGERPYGYISFYYDLTDCLRYGEENVIAVRADHSDFADSRWYTGSGIYRDVYLIVTDRVHIEPWGLFITTPKINSDSAEVAVETTVGNDSDKAAEVRVVSTILDRQGTQVGEVGSGEKIPAGARLTVQQRVEIDRPELWSPQRPYLYRLRSRVLVGEEIVDEIATAFGVRYFRFDADEGFFLNGRNMLIKGACLHHDAGALGAAVPDEVRRRRLVKLKEMGSNAIRCSHNPPDPGLLDLCDSMGFLVMDEAFDEWARPKKKWVKGRNVGEPSYDGYAEHFEKWAECDLRDMILRDRNHPSIILWSIGNEIDYPNDPYEPNSPELVPIAKKLVAVAKRFDTTRPVTAALANVPGCLFADELDVVGYNYQEKLYAEHHRKYPRRVIYGSENGDALKNWLAVADNDFISAQFLWTGVDYLGEAGEWPDRVFESGLMDIAGFEKPAYYWRRSLWVDEPMVYVHRWRGRIMCYSNCDEVELFADGKSRGTKQPGRRHIAVWETDCDGCDLRAVASNDGEQSCVYELPAAGEPYKLVIKPDEKELRADGEDVVQVEAYVTNREGVVVDDAENVIQCEVSGPARLLGLGTGNVEGDEDLQAKSRKAYRGHCLAVVQSEPQAGTVRIRFNSAGLEPAEVVLESTRPGEKAQ